MDKIITRFAPSPTGHLHIGGARTALFNWLLARSMKGTFILRIEDTDALRSKEEYTQAILSAMTWLGLDWDDLHYQSQRTGLHLDYIQKLLDAGKAYYCHCTPEEVTARREKALREGGKPKYDGLCREKNLGPAPGAVVRFKSPAIGTTHWPDLIKGPIAFENSELDDLVILKSDGMPTYNMAVVVDDVTMGITHIVRGDDHVNNTPRQILLYQALEVPLPAFAHVPMILGSDKTRLSKRHGATSVMAYQEMGYLPEALVNYLARLGWSHGDEEIFSRDDLLAKFTLDNVGRSAGVFDHDKLNWLNAHYIKESTAERLSGLVKPFLESRGLKADDDKYLSMTIPTLQPRAKTLVEMAEGAEFYFVDEVEYDPKAAKKFLKQDLTAIMTDLKRRMEALDEFTETALEHMFNALAEENEFKLGKIAQPVRVALTGKTASPGLFEIITILGKERVVKRLSKAIDFMTSQPETAS